MALACPSASVAQHPLPGSPVLPGESRDIRPSLCRMVQRARPTSASVGRRHACGAVRASAAGSASYSGEPEDPYKVLGLSPLDGFEQVKVAHRKRAREAAGDEAALERLEKAYDAIMMQQLTRRKQGLTFGSLKVSEEVKYADKASLFPWGPRYERSSKKVILANTAVSVLAALWIVVAQHTEYKVLQILLAYYTFTLFIKLDPFYPAKQEEDEKPWARNGRRLVRSLSLVFGCVAVASVVHSVAYHAFSLFGYYVPRTLLTFQELLITLACNLGMFNLGSYFR